MGARKWVITRSGCALISCICALVAAPNFSLVRTCIFDRSLCLRSALSRSSGVGSGL